MVSPSDALQALRQDHEAVRQALADLERWLARSPEEAGGEDLDAAVRFLAEDLEPHLAREETALFPVLERHIGREGGPVQVMLLEHEDLRRLWPAFRGAVAEGRWPEAARLGRALAELLAAHVHKEDMVLFPLAEHLLAPEELEEVRRTLAGG